MSSNVSASVRRLDGIWAVLILAAAGCVGSIEDTSGGPDGGGLTPAQQMAEAAFVSQALPAMSACLGCHASATPGELFLAGSDAADQRTTLLGFSPQVVNLDAPQSSRILSKGAHSGPALAATDASAILQWIEAEKVAADDGSGGAVTLIQTPEFQPLLCTSGSAGSTTCPINTVALDTLGATGASIQLVVQELGTGIYVNELQLIGGTGSGAYIEHPLFVSYPAGMDPKPDSLDRYFATAMDQPAGSNSYIDGGTAAFMGFAGTDELSIIFKVVAPYRPDTGTGSGSGTTTTGCKQLASFKTNAQPGLIANCASCHAGTNSGATAAMDLTKINATDDPTILLACDQVLGQLNLTDIENSGFFLAPNPNDATNHPFKFSPATAYTTFHDAVAIWANAEKTSP